MPGKRHSKECKFVTPEIISLLETVSARELEMRFGVSRKTIMRRRWALGRKAPGGNSVFRWTAEALALVGTAGDQAIAERIGTSRRNVCWARSVLKQNVNWSRGMLQSLGKASDKAIAVQFQIAEDAVSLKRQVLDIPRFYPKKLRVNWTRGMLDDLTVLKSDEVAKKYNLPGRVVSAKRRELNLPLRHKGGTKSPAVFTEKMIALLGKRPDKVLARNFMMSKIQILNKRKSLGIPSHKASCSKWTPEAMALLGKISDAELARKLGIASPSVVFKRQKCGVPSFRPRKLKWTREMLACLGRMSDEELSERFKIGKTSVHRKRCALGIPNYLASVPNFWTQDRIALLGTMTDRALGQLLNTTQKSVEYKRTQFKISSFASRMRRPHLS